MVANVVYTDMQSSLAVIVIKHALAVHNLNHVWMEFGYYKGLLKHTEVVYVFIAVMFFFISFQQRSAKLAPPDRIFPKL